MKQCPNGHIYDEKKDAQCPYCANADAVNVQPAFPKTAPAAAPASEPFPPTIPVAKPSQNGIFEGGSSLDNAPKSMGMTVALSRNEKGISPVKGWLVAVDGDKMGRSFELHSEQNSVGRGSNFDIDLYFDKTVSSDGSAVIAFDGENGKFYISPIFGKGKNNVYYNNNMLLMPAELFDYDKLKIGSCTYIFRSFCNEHFSY